MHIGTLPSDTIHKEGIKLFERTGGQTGVDPVKLNERTLYESWVRSITFPGSPLRCSLG